MYAVYAAGDIHYANIIRYVVKEKLPRCALFTNRPSLRPPTCDRVPPAGSCARFSPAYSCESTDESSPWYGYVSESAPSFDTPDMTVYIVFDWRRRPVSIIKQVGATTHQPISGDVPLAPGALVSCALRLKSEALHLLVRHELDRAVAHADERKQRAAVQPRHALRAVHGPQPI